VLVDALKRLLRYTLVRSAEEKKAESAETAATKSGSRMEYVLLGVLLFAALMAFPAFRDVQKIQEFIIAICAGG